MAKQSIIFSILKWKTSNQDLNVWANAMKISCRHMKLQQSNRKQGHWEIQIDLHNEIK